MKFKLFTAIALCAMALISCDEDTGTLGDSLTEETDRLVVSTQNFNVLTQSTAAGSLYSRERQCYVGKVLDPETGTIVKSEFTAQFNMMEHVAEDLPSEDEIVERDENGEILASNCLLSIHFDVPSSYGDTLATMKLRMSELDRPITGNASRYTDFDAKKEGYIREGGYRHDQVFSMRDLTMSDSVRYLIDTNLHRNANTSDNGYADYIRVWLDETYTDKNGKIYPDYGTYVLRTFYDHPEYYKNSYEFIKNVCPGFHFETVDGIGVMARIREISMYIFYSIVKDGDVGYTYIKLSSTEEVVQTSTVINDNAAINKLIADNSCTYVKSPAGIFTEVELPVDEILGTHSNDSLLSAKVAFKRVNNLNKTADLSLPVPSKLLLIEKDSLDNFFIGNNTYNNTYAYLTTLSSNAYSYSNISNLITRIYKAKSDGIKSDPDWVEKHPNWNKALLVPIEEVSVTATSSYGSSSSTIIALKNKMGLSSTKLVRGTPVEPINVEVIYAKFKD